MYKKFYQSVGEERPQFPDRYLTSVLLGRIDLVDIISYEDLESGEGPYTPKEDQLKEPTESEYIFVCRNPQYLEIPLRMQG